MDATEEFKHKVLNATEELKGMKKAELLEFAKRAIETITQIRMEYTRLEKEYDELEEYKNVLRDRLRALNCANQSTPRI